MLDKMLEVAYRTDLKKTASRTLVDKLKEFPLEELQRLADGDPECKLAYALSAGDVKQAGDSDFCWLDKYKGTPLFSKAVELEKSLLQLDMEEQQQREQERAARPQPSDVWARRDALCLQKRMLDLDLVMAQNGGAPAEPAAPEAKEEQAIGELEEAQAQEALEGGGGDAEHEQLEDAAIQQLQAAHGGGSEGPPQAPPQEKAPPKPKAKAEGKEEGGEEEPEAKPEEKKDEKPKEEQKTAGVWEGRSREGVAPGTTVPVQQAGGNRQGAGASDDLPLQAAEKMAAAAVNAGAFLAKTAKVGMHGSDSEKSKVRAAVAKKYPGLEKGAAGSPGQIIDALGHGAWEGADLAGAVAGGMKAHDAGASGLGVLGGAMTGGTGAVLGSSAGRFLGERVGDLAARATAPMGLSPGLAGAIRPAAAALGTIGGGLGGYKLLTRGYADMKAKNEAKKAKDEPKSKEAGMLGTALGAVKPLAQQAGGVLSAGKNLATSAYAKGGLGQVASSFGNVAKNFAQKNPLAAAGIAGAGGLAAGKMLSNSQPRQ